jgi:hypothetical protein
MPPFAQRRGTYKSRVQIVDICFAFSFIPLLQSQKWGFKNKCTETSERKDQRLSMVEAESIHIDLVPFALLDTA